MSDTLSPKVWIENFVLSCARKYGSKFAKPTEQKGYRVQLIEFLTRRTPEQPGAAVWALASDGQYYIPIKFATSAVNEFRGVDGKPAILEDYWCGIFILKGTFTLQYYRIPRKYINGKPSGLEDVNKLYLEVTRVQYVGSMHEPIFVRPRILKRDGMPDLVIQQEAVESVGNVAAAKRWMESLEKGDGDILKREWDTQNAEEVEAKPTNPEQQMLSVRAASRYPMPSANERQETNCPPSEHWPPFWKEAFNEYPRLFDSSPSEGSGDEEYFKERDADARHEIIVPILPTNEPLRPSVEKEDLDQLLELGTLIPVLPISPVVPSTPPFHSSPGSILTGWSSPTPDRLRTRPSTMEDATRSPDETTERAVLWKGSAELEDNDNISKTPVEQGNTTSSVEIRTEQSSASNGVSLEADEVNNEILVPSSNQKRPGRQQPLRAGSLRRLQLTPRRTQEHQGQLRTEYSTSHTVPMPLTKRNPAPFPSSQPLISQPRATSTQVFVPASVEETSQEITSSDSTRIPPGQVHVSRESQESRSAGKSTAPEPLIAAFAWEMTAGESIRIYPSGLPAVSQELQETNLTSQNTGEAEASLTAPDPLANRDHRWKSKIGAMLSSSPIYPTLSSPNSPAVGTSIRPTNSESNSDIAYRQYMEDNHKAKQREDSPTSGEEGMESQLEMDELDGASSKASNADESGESDETDDKQEGQSKLSGVMAGKEEHIKKRPGYVEVGKQHKPSQGVLDEQEAVLTSAPEAPPNQSEKRVEESVQPTEGGEPQEFANIGSPDTEDGDHNGRIHARLACTPVQESQGEPRAEEVQATQREAEQARWVEAHGGTETDDAMEGQREAENRGREGIERLLPSEARETRLPVKSTVLLETTHEALQDIRLQQESHSHSSMTRTFSTSLHRPKPQVPKTRAPRRLPWHLAGSGSRSPSASISSPPSPPKQDQVLGKRKRVSTGDDVREQATTPSPFFSLKMSVKRTYVPEVLLQSSIQHQDVIKRRKIEFVDMPLTLDFEESESDLDELPIDNLRLKEKRDGKAPAIRVQDGSPFSRNKPPRPLSVAVPSPLPAVDRRGGSSPGEGKVQPSRPTVHAGQSAFRVVPSTSVRGQLPVDRSRSVSAQSNKVQQRPSCRVPSRASTRYLSPVSSLFREHESFSERPSAAPSSIDHSDFSELRDDLSIMSTDTLPHIDFLKRKPVLKRSSSTTQSLRR